VIKVVLDINILVSALWTAAGNATTIINMILSDRIIPCFDERILNEYRDVLRKPKLAFPSGQVDELLTEISGRGIAVTVSPSTITMPDETDRKFYDVAAFCKVYLITGNIKHYPKEPLILNPGNFLKLMALPTI